MVKVYAHAWMWLAFVAVGAGCTKPNPASTCPDGICKDPSHRYCDVNGVIGGDPNTCLAVDCTPGAFQACDGSNALICNPAGNSYDTTFVSVRWTAPA
jgi:hypothetical protein